MDRSGRNFVPLSSYANLLSMEKTCIDCGERSRWVKRLCRRCYYRRWREEHPDYQRAWKAANPEKVIEYRRRYAERQRPGDG